MDNRHKQRVLTFGTKIAHHFQLLLEARMRYFFVKTIAIATFLVLPMDSVKAAIISATYTVTGSNFTSTGSASPYTSITESFTISFNNAVLVSQQSAGISLNPASTIIPSSTLVFTYVPGADSLVVGGLAGTVATADPNSTDFSLTISNASNPANFSITALSYTIGTGVTYSALTRAMGTLPTPVPEPISLALVGSAAAMVAFVRRRRTSH